MLPQWDSPGDDKALTGTLELGQSIVCVRERVIIIGKPRKELGPDWLENTEELLRPRQVGIFFSSN